jgi:speckle-type POZ protein
MREATSRHVVIKGTEAEVFKAMLRFIHTDTVRELDRQEGEAAMTMAQHLLVTADRYALDMLKLICESKLLSCITADTATTTLALAQLHNCKKAHSQVYRGDSQDISTMIYRCCMRCN